MDGKRREEIKARAEAATPGEWEAFQLWEDGDIITGGGNFEICTPEYDVCAYIKNSAPIRREADAAFIAHARQDIPDLLAEVERLRAQVVAANRTLEAIRDLARTGLAPDALNMTPAEWAEHKLHRIARMAVHAMEDGAP